MKTLTKLIKHRLAWRFLGLLLADGVVFGATNPRTAPSYMLISGFLLLSITVYYLFEAILTLLGLYGLKLKHRQRLVRIFTVLAGGLIALQSVGQLAPHDIFVLSPLCFLLYLYTSYAKSMKQNLQTKRL